MQHERPLAVVAEDKNERNLIRGGARIEFVFSRMFVQAINKQRKALDDLTATEITTKIKNVAGLGGGLFIPDAAFWGILRERIVGMAEPASQCVQLVYDELVNIVGSSSREVRQMAKSCTLICSAHTAEVHPVALG